MQPLPSDLLRGYRGQEEEDTPALRHEREVYEPVFISTMTRGAHYQPRQSHDT